MAKSLYMLLLLTTYPLLLMVSGTYAVSCSDAVNELIPCGSYLTGAGGNIDPSAECCSSARALATTIQSKRQLCECLTTNGPSFGGLPVMPMRAARLVQVCFLNQHIPVGPNVDCSRYCFSSTALLLV